MEASYMSIYAFLLGLVGISLLAKRVVKNSRVAIASEPVRARIWPRR
jgi:hypothetical protein